MSNVDATMQDQALHPVLAAIVVELTHERNGLLAAADRIPVHLRHTRSAPDRWTAAEILAHLAKVEASSGKLFSVHARALREANAPLDTTSDAATIVADFARFPLLVRSRRITAPDMVTPDADADFDTARLQLESSRAHLLEAIYKANGLPLGSVSAPHPRLGSMTMYEWLLMIARHEARHVEQLRELSAQLLSDTPQPLPE